MMQSAKFDKRSALVLGAGKSGFAAGMLLLSRGGRATIVDEAWTTQKRAEMACQGLSVATAPHETLPDGSFDLVVVSPSIPSDHPWLACAKSRGIHIISELELAATYWQGEAIAVTGSKGKSSVVKCLAETLSLAGKPALPAGNYGTPLCELVTSLPNGGQGVIAVVEVSSFQMEHTRRFAPHLAAILNVQADHLDRHHTMEVYIQEKRKIFQSQKPEVDKAFLPCDFSDGGAIPQGVTLERFGEEPYAQWCYEPNCVINDTLRIPVEGYFNNPVLGRAAALVAAMLTAEGLTPEQISNGFATFQPLPHRMQQIGVKRGVKFIDDSKATTLAATQAALQMTPSPIRLIAGGLLKETDLTFLANALRERVAKVYLIGQASDALYQAWHDIVPCAPCEVMAEAVRRAFSESASGETILLSPGTASFDQYHGMAERGRDFAACFDKL